MNLNLLVSSFPEYWRLILRSPLRRVLNYLAGCEKKLVFGDLIIYVLVWIKFGFVGHWRSGRTGALDVTDQDQFLAYLHLSADDNMTLREVRSFQASHTQLLTKQAIAHLKLTILLVWLSRGPWISRGSTPVYHSVSPIIYLVYGLNLLGSDCAHILDSWSCQQGSSGCLTKLTRSSSIAGRFEVTSLSQPLRPSSARARSLLISQWYWFPLDLKSMIVSKFGTRSIDTLLRNLQWFVP